MRTAAAVVLTALLAVLVAGGCTTSKWDTSGIDDTTPTTVKRYPKTEAGLIGSLTAYLSTVGDDLDEWAPPHKAAECAATRLVRRLTVDHLLELGYDPQKPTLALGYPEDEKASVVNVLLGCIDFSEGILEMMSSYLKLPLAESNCLAEGFDRLGLDRDLATAMVDGTEPDPFAANNHFGAGLSSLADQCLDEEDLPPAGPLAALPKAGPDSPTTSTSTIPSDDATDDSLGGIVPGGPLDTTSTVPR
jgi:hypothetical protein